MTHSVIIFFFAALSAFSSIAMNEFYVHFKRCASVPVIVRIPWQVHQELSGPVLYANYLQTKYEDMSSEDINNYAAQLTEADAKTWNSHAEAIRLSALKNCSPMTIELCSRYEECNAGDAVCPHAEPEQELLYEKIRRVFLAKNGCLGQMMEVRDKDLDGEKLYCCYAYKVRPLLKYTTFDAVNRAIIFQKNKALKEQWNDNARALKSAPPGARNILISFGDPLEGCDPNERSTCTKCGDKRRFKLEEIPHPLSYRGQSE